MAELKDKVCVELEKHGVAGDLDLAEFIIAMATDCSTPEELLSKLEALGAGISVGETSPPNQRLQVD